VVGVGMTEPWSDWKQYLEYELNVWGRTPKCSVCGFDVPGIWDHKCPAMHGRVVVTVDVLDRYDPERVRQ
jgi:hypothetical protein